MAVRCLPQKASPQRLLRAHEEPKDAQTEPHPTFICLLGDEDVVGWLDQKRDHGTLSMLVVLSRADYRGPGPEGQEDYDGTDTPIPSRDPPYPPLLQLVMSILQVCGGANSVAEEEASNNDVIHPTFM